MLRAFVNQRLTSAADEIFELFERTIAEYEEKLDFCSKEKNRQRKLLDAVYNPEVRLHKTDVQQLLVVRNEVPAEQQKWSSSLDQKDPEPPHIKEEQKEVWTSQEREQLQELEEDDIKFPLTAVTVKSEEEEQEKAQSSQPHGSQTEEDEEGTVGDEEDCRGSEPARNSGSDSPLQPAIHENTAHSSEPETDDSSDWEGMEEPQPGLNSLENYEVTGSDVECNNEETSVNSSECAKRFVHKGHLKKNTGIQTGEKPFSCSVCGKRFPRKKYFMAHMRFHSDEKCFSCSVCKMRFNTRGNLVTHMRTHTWEKPFKCSVCGKGFSKMGTLSQHSSFHTGEKPFSCSFCSNTFADNSTLRRHLIVHTGEKPFSCSVCSKRFRDNSSLRRHSTVHTWEKPINGSIGNKRFTRLDTQTKHKCVGESSRKSSCRDAC